MTDIWIVLVEDRHTDVEATPFSSAERAVAAARSRLPEPDADDELTPRMIEDGWVFLAFYGTEGDRVRIVKRTLRGGS